MSQKWQIALYGFCGAVFGGIVGGRMMNDGPSGYVVQAIAGAGATVGAFVVVRWMNRKWAQPVAR